ncbi:MAG TPA: SprT family zinc-dependent metalloprotease [Candidatus Saccharimonadales bacterium]|jgi:hypothetical protein|nr:SprT family zinc-dependent metalloprotease [Candidatus Saccharimonadales bacterium]
MPSKQFILDSGLTVNVYKRRGNRNLRLSVNHGGQVRVSIPAWAPYKAGLDFVRSREPWIRSQQLSPRLLRHGQAIGKAHHLEFAAKAGLIKPSSRIRSSAVVVTHPTSLEPNSSTVQNEAEKACVRALRAQAEQLLPQRLANLASQYGFTYNQVGIKRLKSRWGSCDQGQNIVLNLFLIQLPWDLIDYVLLHELTHTQVLKHGPVFWEAMSAKMPDTKRRRQALRNYHPVLNGDIA